jgi:hypothetical protein
LVRLAVSRNLLIIDVASFFCFGLFFVCLLQLVAGKKLQQQLQQQHLPLDKMSETFSKMQLVKINQLQQHLLFCS